MSRLVKILSVICLCLVFGQVNAAELKTDKQKYSYASGFILANQLAGQLQATGLTDIDADAFAAAMADVLAGRDPQLDIQAMKTALDKQRDQIVEQNKKKAEAATARGKAFQEKNKQAEGVNVLENGLQYQVVKAGDGAQPEATDTVEVHYHGTLVDGTVFDSSVQRGTPASFPLNGVIPGFREAITRMKTGGKWKVVMPSELAYGENGAPPKIGPNETLIFEIELLGIK